MFLVECDQDQKSAQFVTGDPADIIQKIFKKERIIPSDDFSLHVSKIPVVTGVKRIA